MAPPVDPRGAGAGPGPWASRAHVRGEHDPPCGPSGSTRELHRIHTVGEPEPPAGPTGCTLCCKWIHRVLHVVPLGSSSGPRGRPTGPTYRPGWIHLVGTVVPRVPHIGAACYECRGLVLCMHGPPRAQGVSTSSSSRCHFGGGAARLFPVLKSAGSAPHPAFAGVYMDKGERMHNRMFYALPHKHTVKHLSVNVLRDRGKCGFSAAFNRC